jgi:hypothetical protein
MELHTENLDFILKKVFEDRMSLKVIYFALSLAPTILLFGCTYGNKVSYDNIGRIPKAPEQVQVFESRDVKRPYKVIGLVSSDSYYMHSALAAIRKEAGELGADAVIDFGPSGNQTGMGYAYGAGPGIFGVGSSYNTGFAARAIVWE